jgi:DNA-directed RNA polymerase subunit RPC12/RpoP
MTTNIPMYQCSRCGRYLNGAVTINQDGLILCSICITELSKKGNITCPYCGREIERSSNEKYPE